ncbi:MAG TPA: hypothetical protein DCY94_02365 [Firmicutes bacterium]|nr:hypothetical protein [Bacillota bacterium]
MQKKDTIAFDLGGVLSYRDLSSLNEEERFLLEVYMNRYKVQDRELLAYATSKIPEIYLKINHLRSDAEETLQMVKDEHLTPSIWTNNIGAIDVWFESVGLYKFVRREDIVNSFYIGVDKPNVEFYKKALEIIKKHKDLILFFDDDAKNVEGAIKSGIESVHFDSARKLPEVLDEELRKIKKI